MIYINAREAAFLRKASATSIGAAYGRLFRLRKTAMLSRHWRLWLSFPSLALPPGRAAGVRVGMFLHALVPPEGGGCVSDCTWCESTAADRAAADVRRW